jgi:crotonobetainyl-CoA:carnitine CoA-transferase CaiB-like acyl-CoA transferase
MALADLTVLDLAPLAAAPQIAAFFGDFGARVVKVEPPRGDPLRHLVDAAGAAVQWKLVNRNKQCVTLDVARPEGRTVLERMLGRTDVLVSAWPAERLAAWGLDATALCARHPRLVAVNLTTFGVRGPWRDRVGSGTLAEAASGLAHLTGPADRPPTLAPVGLGDWLGILQGIVAALLGLYERDHGGTAAAFDVAMCDPIVGLLGQRLTQTARSGVDPGRHGNRFPTMAPRDTYRTADGRWVALTAGTDDMVRRLFAAMGHPTLADDPRFATNLARLAHADALDAVIAEWVGSRTCDDVVAACVAARVSLAAVDDLPVVLRNPHFRARGTLVDVDDPDVGAVTTSAPLPLRPEAPGIVRHLGRALGADNVAVYRDWLGLSDAELEALAAAGVV